MQQDEFLEMCLGVTVIANVITRGRQFLETLRDWELNSLEVQEGLLMAFQQKDVF